MGRRESQLGQTNARQLGFDPHMSVLGGEGSCVGGILWTALLSLDTCLGLPPICSWAQILSLTLRGVQASLPSIAEAPEHKWNQARSPKSSLKTSTLPPHLLTL